MSDKKAQIEALKPGIGVYALLQKGKEILGNPMVMLDTSYQLMCYTPFKSDDPLWNELINDGSFSHETVDFFMREGFIDSFSESDVIAHLPSPHLKYDRYNGKLFDRDGVQLANINLAELERPFEPGVVEEFEAFCEVMSAELQSSEYYNKLERVYEELSINRLIMGDKHLNSELWDPYRSAGQHLYFAVFDISHYDHTMTHLAYFRDLFRQLTGIHTFYVHANNIVALFSTDKEVFEPEREFTELCAFMKKYGIVAGMSGRFYNVFELEKHYHNAVDALNMGVTIRALRVFFRYDFLRLELFLNEIKDTVDVSSIICPLAFTMRDYDKAHGTKYIETMTVFMVHGLRKNETCEKLGIQEDELDRRVADCDRLFAVNLGDGNMLVNIYYSLKLIETLDL